ncbi:hypothetical protein SprV_0301171700 [Sparganum proliferum]
MPTQISRANRRRRTSSDAMHQQPTNVNFSPHSRPYRRPATTTDHTVAASPPFTTDTIRFAPNPCVDHSDQLHQHHDISHSPTDGKTSNVPSYATLTTKTPTPSDVDSLPTCPHCDRTFISHVGLVGHLRIHCAEAEEPAPRAPTYTRASTLTALTDTANSFTAWTYTVTRASTKVEFTAVLTHSTPIMPISTNTPSPSASTNRSSIVIISTETDYDAPSLSCSHCPRTFTSHIDWVSHLRIRRREIDEPVPGAPIYTRRLRLNCSHCLRTFSHRMDLLSHMYIHLHAKQALPPRSEVCSPAPSTCGSSAACAIRVRDYRGEPWLGILPNDASAQSTQSAQLCAFV